MGIVLLCFVVPFRCVTCRSFCYVVFCSGVFVMCGFFRVLMLLCCYGIALLCVVFALLCFV